MTTQSSVRRDGSTTDKITHEGQTLEVPAVTGMVLFEVYEADGSLLYVTSSLNDYDDPRAGDYVVRREWATAAMPTLVRTVAGGDEP